MPNRRHSRVKRYSPSATKARLAFVAVTILFFSVTISLLKEVFRGHSVTREVADLQAEISSLESENGGLQSLISYLQSPTYAEEEARMKLGLQKPGEQVLAVPGVNANTEQEQPGSSVAANSSSDRAPQSNASKWWAFIFSSHR